MNLKTYLAIVLAVAGLLLAGMGAYFIFLRPPLLLEDLSYMGLTLQKVSENIPGLLNWLQKVFLAMGGYIFATGVLTVFISFTSFRAGLPGAFSIVALAGISSIGSMTIVNFMIGSDFKWVLLSFTILWAIGLILYLFHR